ncbi:MAG: flagellar basal body rod protein FlgC [Gammaproteobacteria bacterium]|nr:flagellar basal body rod protein FlgC [Gammaproteobacteria bacterium]PCH62671.1 MAG: flagellar basal body rod protein FlgC [Gammaproteobacteria bacterium]
MALFGVFDVVGSAMNAQTVRLNTTASNLANANTIAENPEDTYRARHPVFATMIKEFGDEATAGVRVSGIVESQSPLRTEFAPDHPFANEEGYITLPNVNAIEEMTNMISASRSYQQNVEVLNTTKQLLQRTLTIGQ